MVDVGWSATLHSLLWFFLVKAVVYMLEFDRGLLKSLYTIHVDVAFLLILIQSYDLIIRGVWVTDVIKICGITAQTVYSFFITISLHLGSCLGYQSKATDLDFLSSVEWLSLIRHFWQGSRVSEASTRRLFLEVFHHELFNKLVLLF